MKRSNIYGLFFGFFVLCFLLLSQPMQGAATSTSFSNLPKGVEMRVHYALQQEKVWGVVELRLAADYYAYAPQDAQGKSVNAGQATQLAVFSQAGTPLPVYLPRGVDREDYYEKNKQISAYTGSVFAFILLGSVQDVGQGVHFEGKLSLLLCSQKHCLPVRTSVHLSIPENIPLMKSQSYASLWEEAVSLGAQPLPTAMAVAQEQELAIAHDTTDAKKRGAFSGGLASSLATFEAGQSLSQLQDAKQHAPAMTTASSSWQFTPRAYAESLEVTGLGKALLLGLLAGLILNLMPCVLPVLTLKVQALLLNESGEARIQAFRTHNLFFAAGIMTQFFILGIILGSLGLMWGELFQNVYFVASMLVVIFVLALSLLGVFSLPMLDIKATAHASPHRQAFITGMVATLLATPCSGPLLGGVLSWAFLQPLYLIIVTIMAVGLGMALPYLLFAWRPHWVRIVPKPGAWMGVLEKMVAFFLFATALYIFSILPTYTYMPMLLGLWVLSLLGWVWGQWGGLGAPAWRRHILAVLFVLCMAGVVSYGAQEPEQNSAQWQDFSIESFQSQLGESPLLVEFTADWCPNCKYVEKTVLTPENLQTWEKKYGVKLIKVDITRDNLAGEALLHALGSRSIPMTAVFGLGEEAKSPIVIRDIYTKETLEGALQQALSK